MNAFIDGFDSHVMVDVGKRPIYAFMVLIVLGPVVSDKKRGTQYILTFCITLHHNYATN